MTTSAERAIFEELSLVVAEAGGTIAAARAAARPGVLATKAGDICTGMGAGGTGSPVALLSAEKTSAVALVDAKRAFIRTAATASVLCVVVSPTVPGSVEAARVAGRGTSTVAEPVTPATRRPPLSS
jgi:hypothetical protein